METLWVDFNNCSVEGVRLNSNGTIAEIKEKNIVLYRGLELLVWMEDFDDEGKRNDLIAESKVEYSDNEKVWIAKFDFIMHQSDKYKTPVPPSGG